MLFVEVDKKVLNLELISMKDIIELDKDLFLICNDKKEKRKLLKKIIDIVVFHTYL